METSLWEVTLTTDSNGDATATTPHFSGIINAIKYTNTDFSTSVGFDIAGTTSGITIWNESPVASSKTVYPVTTSATTDGSSSAISESPIVVSEPVTITVSSGGDTKTGKFSVIVLGNANDQVVRKRTK